MRRRAFMALLAGTAATWPFAGQAQQLPKPLRIGVLANDAWPPLEGLREGLRDLGYVEGENLVLAFRFAEGRADRYPALAAELIALGVDVIVTAGTPASIAAKRATGTIPIVFQSGDPVGAGLVATLARPGGNATGFSGQGPEGEVKRLALLKELLPDLSRVAVLSNPSNPYCIVAVAQAQLGAAALGVQLELVEALSASALDKAYPALIGAHPDAVLVIGDPFLVGQRTRIAEFLINHRLPSMFTFHDHTRAGGLMSYSTNYHDLFRRAAVVVDRIARGARPDDLPVQQPTVFELMINLKTASALGLTIPPALLARANEVIE